jgi:hypothetical protein
MHSAHPTITTICGILKTEECYLVIPLLIEIIGGGNYTGVGKLLPLLRAWMMEGPSCGGGALLALPPTIGTYLSQELGFESL